MKCISPVVVGRAFLLLLFTVAAPIAMAQDATYVGSNSCKICHNKAADGAQFNQWKETGHSKALETLKSAASIEIAKKLGLSESPSESAACLVCHVTAYDVKALKPPAKVKVTNGVSCEACHGPSSEHVAAAKRFRIKKDPSIDLTSMRERPTKENCLRCHNEKSVTWDPKRYTLKDGSTAGFSFELAYPKVEHLKPAKPDE